MRTLLIFIFISLISTFAVGQEQENDDQSLKLFIKPNKKQVCFGGVSNITAQLTNIGKKPIVIDTKRIGYTVDFNWLIDTPNGISGGSYNSIGDVGYKYEPNFIILQPNESYLDNLKIAFDDKVFTKTQKYAMQTAYGQFLNAKIENMEVWQGVVESNEIDIFINKCGRK